MLQSLSVGFICKLFVSDIAFHFFLGKDSLKNLIDN